MAILKRQLEEKEKLLATEQEDAAVVKSKLREVNKVGCAPARPGAGHASAAPGSWAGLPAWAPCSVGPEGLYLAFTVVCLWLWKASLSGSCRPGTGLPLVAPVEL